MKDIRILVIAVVLIAFSFTGVIVRVASVEGQTGESSGDKKMSGGGMMGGGMMDREGMKEMMQRMMPDMLPPGIKPEALPEPDSRGAKLLSRYCTQCHNLPSPAMHSAVEWPAITNRMFSRMSMMSGMMGMMNVENPSSEERQTIVAYLQAHSMRTISPGALPAPESKGAVLFRETCSQCHSLPDPQLHTAAEWPKVLERMRGNMDAMKKKVISEQDRKTIEEYLMSHARK
ncbi:MAG: cytochrome c [Nitrospiraceae bacterium]|nr:cytochrome c [Nitrospiraceae bacterium]